MVLDTIQSYFTANYNQFALSLILLIVGFVVIRIINRYLSHLLEKGAIDDTLQSFLHKMIRVFLWSILITAILGNLGFDVTGFIAGLSIIGFIVGFAVKDVLANLAAGIMILMNRPFNVGDTVIAAGTKGIVKEISMSACILEGEEQETITIPNSKIWGSPIKNLLKEETDNKDNAETNV